MGAVGFEPTKAEPPDLQSGPFGRLGIHPHPDDRRGVVRGHSSRGPAWGLAANELAVRVELTTVGLQNRCSAD